MGLQERRRIAPTGWSVWWACCSKTAGNPNVRDSFIVIVAWASVMPVRELLHSVEIHNTWLEIELHMNVRHNRQNVLEKDPVDWIKRTLHTLIILYANTRAILESRSSASQSCRPPTTYTCRLHTDSDLWNCLLAKSIFWNYRYRPIRFSLRREDGVFIQSF